MNHRFGYLGVHLLEYFTAQDEHYLSEHIQRVSDLEADDAAPLYDESASVLRTLLIDNQSEEIRWQKLARTGRVSSWLMRRKLLQALRNRSFPSAGWAHSKFIVESAGDVNDGSHSTPSFGENREGLSVKPGRTTDKGNAHGGSWLRLFAVQLEVPYLKRLLQGGPEQDNDPDVISVSLLREAAYRDSCLPLGSTLFTCMQPDGQLRHLLFQGGYLRFSRLLPDDLLHLNDSLPMPDHAVREPANAASKKSGLKLISELQNTLRHLSSKPDVAAPNRIFIDSRLHRHWQSAEQAAGLIQPEFVELPDIIGYYVRHQRTRMGRRKLSSARLSGEQKPGRPNIENMVLKRPFLPLTMLSFLGAGMLFQGWQAMSLVTETKLGASQNQQIQQALTEIPNHEHAFGLAGRQVLEVLDLYDSLRFRSTTLPARLLLALAEVVSADSAIEVDSIDWSVEPTTSAVSNNVLVTHDEYSGASILDRSVWVSFTGRVAVEAEEQAKPTQQQIERAYETYLDFLVRLEESLPLEELKQSRLPFDLAADLQSQKIFSESLRSVDNEFSIGFSVNPVHYLSAIKNDLRTVAAVQSGAGQVSADSQDSLAPGN